jgi:hypothetical protein
MTIELIAIEDPERERLAKLYGELNRLVGPYNATLDDIFAKMINASAVPRYILKADTPEELQGALEKIGK